MCIYRLKLLRAILKKKVHVMSFALIDAALKMCMLPEVSRERKKKELHASLDHRFSLPAVCLSKIRQFMAKFESVILFDVIIL